MGAEDTVQAYFDAFRRGDVTALANLFTEDAVIAPLGMDTITSQGVIVNRSAKTAEQVHYRELFCLRRSNGDWRIASYMFNR